MTATKEFLTFEEYLRYDDGTDTRYELYKGELIPVSQPRGRHVNISRFLESVFNNESDRLGLNLIAIRGDVGVRVPQVGRRDTSRIPDIVILPMEQWDSMENREAVIELDEPPPVLIVEVVSPGTIVIDHRHKRAEYNIVGVPAYMLVDWAELDGNGKPIDKRVTIFRLLEGLYELDGEYRENEVVSIPTFPELRLTANQIINAKL